MELVLNIVLLDFMLILQEIVFLPVLEVHLEKIQLQHAWERVLLAMQKVINV